MSILKNAANQVIPIRERRSASGTLAVLNAEVALPVNGDESAIIQVSSAAAVTATIAIEGSMDDGVNYFPLLALPYYSLTGTIPVSAQPMITEAFSAVAPFRVYAVACGQLTHVRVRASAYTSGNLSVRINSDPAFCVHPNMFARTSTLCATNTAAAGSAVTLTLPAVAGLRHYVDRVSVLRSATAALTAAATPVLVTTTNLPGSPVLTFGSDLAGIGLDKELVFDAGATGLAASAINTATTIVCPAYVGVIWRVTAIYRPGL